MQRDGISAPEADKRITKSDKDRDAFHRSYFKVEPNTPALYDLGFNAERINTAVASQMVALAANQLAPHPG